MLRPRGGRVSFTLTSDEVDVLAAASFVGLTGTHSARAGDNCRAVVLAAIERFADDPDVVAMVEQVAAVRASRQARRGHLRAVT